RAQSRVIRRPADSRRAKRGRPVTGLRRSGGSRFIDDVELPGLLYDLLCLNKPPGNDETISCPYGDGVARGIRDDIDALQDLAILLRRVGNAPFADFVLLGIREKLPADIGVLLLGRLPGVALDELLCGEEVVLAIAVGGLEPANWIR